jgi:hypothetical protein
MHALNMPYLAAFPESEFGKPFCDIFSIRDLFSDLNGVPETVNTIPLHAAFPGHAFS